MKKHVFCFLVFISSLLLISPVWGKEKSKKSIFDPSGNLISYYTYRYNEFGKDQKSHYDTSDKLLSYCRYEYDKEGKSLVRRWKREKVE